MIASAASLSAEVRRIAGPDAVAPDDDPRWRVHGRSPRAVALPDSPDAAAALLARASQEGWSVELAGAGTWLDHGAAPAEALELLLSTARMNQRIEAEPADLVVGVDAGVQLRTLHERLAADRQELPLDPPMASMARPTIATAQPTIGAVIALGAAGPLRAGYGSPRDHVLGLTVVTGDGRVLRFGGRVVKNVAGYDIVRLIVGSRGTLGLITSAWLRLRAQPAADRTLAVTGMRDELTEIIAGLAVVDVAAAELLAPATAAAIRAGTGWTFLLRIRGGAAEVDATVARISGLIVGTRVTDSAPDVWDRLAALEAQAGPLLRARRLPAELHGALGAADDFIMRSGKELAHWHMAAHARDGIVRLWPAVGPGAHERAGDAALYAGVDALRRDLEDADGSLLIEAVPPGLREQLRLRGIVDPVTARLESELKRVFDPAGILGRHRQAE